MISRAELDTLSPAPFIRVNIPEWGEVGIKTLTALEGVELRELAVETTAPASMVAASYLRFLCRVLVDDQGQRLYGDDEFGRLASWPNSVVQRLVLAAQRHNGLSEAEEETIRKN